MARFIVAVSHQGPMTLDFADAARTRIRRCSACPPRTTATAPTPLLGQNIISCTHYEPDFDALRAASTRIVLGAGVESEGQMAHRGALAVAERLGTEPVIFPSDHGGFLGGEYGQRGRPGRLRREAARGPRRGLTSADERQPSAPGEIDLLRRIR